MSKLRHFKLVDKEGFLRGGDWFDDWLVKYHSTDGVFSGYMQAGELWSDDTCLILEEEFIYFKEVFPEPLVKELQDVKKIFPSFGLDDDNN